MFRLQYLIARNFDENTRKNEIWKSYLGNKKTKVMFLVVSLSNVRSGA